MHLRATKKLGAEVALNEPIGKDKDDNIVTLEEVLEYIAGLDNIYLDTAYTVNFMPTDIFREIVLKHGADKILFGSDFPWHKSSMEKEFIESLDFSDEDKKKILGENARKLLGL